MKINKKIFFIILLGVLVAPAVALGQAAAGGHTLDGLATSLKNVLVIVGSSVVIIGWVIAGILYLTAAGAPDKIKIAKEAMIACVIGTLLVVLAGSSKVLEDIIKNAFGL